MRKITLFILTTLVGVGCTSKPYRPEPGTLSHFLRKSNLEIMQESMAKMPKNMVSDDTLVVEVYDENGHLRGVMLGK